MEIIAQRFHQNDGDDRAGDGDVKKKSAAAGQQTVQPCVVATEMKTRDVVRDRLCGDGQRQSEKTNESDGGEDEAVFAGFAAELPADDDLKDIMNKRGQKADRGKNDAALQKPAGRAGTVFQRLTHTSGCNSFSWARARSTMSATVCFTSRREPHAVRANSPPQSARNSRRSARPAGRLRVQGHFLASDFTAKGGQFPERSRNVNPPPTFPSQPSHAPKLASCSSASSQR